MDSIATLIDLSAVGSLPKVVAILAFAGSVSLFNRDGMLYVCLAVVLAYPPLIDPTIVLCTRADCCQKESAGPTTSTGSIPSLANANIKVFVDLFAMCTVTRA